MSRIPARARVSVACVALAVLLAGCAGLPGPSTAGPDGGADLHQALPPTTTTTEQPAPTTAAATTTRRKPLPTPVPGTRQVAARAAAVDPRFHPAGGDEFNGAALDTDAWKTYDSAGGFHTGFRKPEAISQVGGLLKITARGDVSGGMGSAHGQLYGRWEFRARTDAGRGFGSAILLWPDSEVWPRDGEVDIMEVPGEKRDLAHFVLHSGEDNRLDGAATPGDYTTWHTFAVEWLPDRVTGYIDGVKRYETTDKSRIPTTPMHLTIQLDQGPKQDWIPARDETTPAEVSLEVDWVRIFTL